MFSYEERKERRERIRGIGYYLVIALISLISLVFLPMLGSNLDGGFEWPTSWEEWSIWIATRLAITGVNIGLFFCFIQQAKTNIRDDPNYVSANERLNNAKKIHVLKPRSPRAFMTKQWLTKGPTIALSTMASVFALSEALLRFDLTEFLTFLFTIGIGLVFGYITMRKNEEYWTTEYPLYVDSLIASKLPQNQAILNVLNNNDNKIVNDTLNQKIENMEVEDNA